jgi:hypothetical protein
MKFAISTATLILLFGVAISTHAQENKQEEHHQDSKPAQHEAKPEQHQQQQSKPAHEQQHQAKPAEHQQTQQSKSNSQERTQQAAHSEHQQSHPESHAENNNHAQSQAHSEHAQNSNAHQSNEHRAGYSHGDRISDAHYASHFGREHSFHVNRGDYDHRRFDYGGYSWGFVEPWPVAWGYSDDVYVVYADGGYYMYNRAHSGVRISINIL